MKRRLLALGMLMLTCGGCVGYYHDPYYYDPYPYSPYSYGPYHPPAYYADPWWLFVFPSLYVDFSSHGGHGGHPHGGYPHGGSHHGGHHR
jgi:hypothetical protein